MDASSAAGSEGLPVQGRPPLRDHARPSPRRTTSSVSSETYYRQGAAAYERSYPDEPLGYTPSRSDRYWLEEDAGGYKGFSRYGGGGGRREGRDMRGSYRRSPFRSYGGDFPRGHQEPPPPPLRRSPLRSVAVPISYDPPGDKADREDREHHPRVTPWRPLRRRETRSDAADAAGAGPTSVRQNTGEGTASEKKAPAQSLAVAAPQTSEEEAPRKKPRLGWGQGLAKYEKQKVHGSADPAEAVADGSSADVEQKVDVGTPASVLCASPVAASPPAPPSSSPDTDNKSCELTTNTATVSNKDVPGAEVQAYNDEIPIKLGQLDGDPIGSLANVLAELLQHDDSCSGDSRKLTNTSKLLLLKENITKEIEKTELEIDSLECELKSANTDIGNRALEDAQNPSPSSGTSKVPVRPEICETSSPLKEQGEISPCKISVEQDTDAKGAESMEVDTAPAYNVTAVSSEESVARPVVAETQVSVAASVAPVKPSRGTGSQIDADSERQGPSSCHDNVNSMKADGSNQLSTRPCSHHVDTHNLIPSILAVNNGMAKEFNELVFKPLPSDQPLSALGPFSIQMKNDLSIKRKLAIHKNRLRFKEQTLTFKFKVLRHLWKEDVRLLCVRKQRPKSNKRTDQSNRASQSGSQRQRSSNRSRLGIPAGNLSTFPTSEISEVANKMFTEFQFKRCRNYLKMPAVIIDEKEKACAMFVSKNGLIEDPVSVEKERAVINPWTHEEKEVFMQMLATFGKNFSKISNFLQHKTTADCVEFYYKHHKSDSFREVKKLLDRRQQQQPTSNYLGTKSGKKWNPEGNAASLDMLGAASVVAAHGLDYANRVEKTSSKSIIRTSYRSDISAVAKGSLDKDCVANVSLHERESVAADVLAGICGTLSPEGMGSCITSSADPGQKMGGARMEYLVTPEVDKSCDEEGTFSDQECEVYSVDWTDDERSIFVEAMNIYGKDFARISSRVKSKSYEQCKVFFSKARISLGLDMIHPRNADAGLPTSDTNGGRSDTDEACAAEIDSAICSTQSSQKMEIDACPAADETTQGCHVSGITFIQSKTDRSTEPVVGDIKFEEAENKAEDRSCNILVDHELLSEATRQASQSCDPIDINSSANTKNVQNKVHGNQVTVHGNVAMSSSTEQPVGSQLEIRSNLHDTEVIQSSKASAGTCTQISSMEGPSNHAPEIALMKVGNFTPSVVLSGDCGSKENVVHFQDMAGVSCIRPAFTSSYQQSVPADLLQSKPKPQVTPLTPKDLMPVQFSSDLPDPTSIRFEGIASITSPNFEDRANKVNNTSGAKDMNRFTVFGERSRNQQDALFRDIDGYMQLRHNHHLPADVPALSESTVSCTGGTSHSDQFTSSKYQNGRSGCSALSNASAGFPLTRNSAGLREGQLETCSQKASTESYDQVKRPGDVKLFGKILSHQSSLQSSGSSSNGIKSKPPSPNIDKSEARLLQSGRDRMVFPSRPANTAHLGLDEQSVMSYTHLDGSPVHPDSMFRAANCQRSLAGVPFYSAKNGTLGGFAEYQQPSMQQLPSDPKRESFADLQKRNGIELISGFQQPGKASRLGGAGIIVGAVSDPVAALKAQYGPGPKILGNNADPWKDLGNR